MNPPIQNLKSMLEESIKHFLTSYHSGCSDFSSFESIFFRLIQTMLDPPLEIAWFYSAVTFHAAKPDPQSNPFARVLRVKDMLKLLISCSNLSCGSKKIALLAPVVCELYSIVRDCRKSGPCVEEEINSLVDNIFNYVLMSAGVYANRDGDIETDGTVVCFEELVRVWVADRGGGTCNFGEILKVFFPLLTNETWKVINARCSIRELVGIVLCEVVFLRLYLTLSSGMHSDEIWKDTQNLVVKSIKGFQNCYFLDMLLKMLLETSLPIADLLSSDDAVLLHNVMYDAVMLADYSSYSWGLAQSPDNRSKTFALVWVLVADCAIQFARSMGDEARTSSYLNAFCKSHLMAELTKWASIQAGTMNCNTRPTISGPTALIRWLLLLEAQGISVFDHSISAIHSKAVTFISNAESNSPEPLHRRNFNLNSHVTNANKDQEMGDDPPTHDFPGSACSMNAKIDTSRKRKESLMGPHELPKKQIKFGFCGNSLGERFSPFSTTDSRLPCGVEVKNATPDEDMELVG